MPSHLACKFIFPVEHEVWFTSMILKRRWEEGVHGRMKSGGGRDNSGTESVHYRDDLVSGCETTHSGEDGILSGTPNSPDVRYRQQKTYTRRPVACSCSQSSEKHFAAYEMSNPHIVTQKVPGRESRTAGVLDAP